MAIIERKLSAKLKEYADTFPVVYLTGPRQSGKSTLLKHVFQGHHYVSLEEKDIRDFAISDPRGFLSGFGSPAIIDEAQYAPDLFSYIQSLVDGEDRAGMFVLSGSQNFLMMKSISQSLAGRVGILSLLPFSDMEIASTGKPTTDTNDWLFSGHYPRMVVRGIKPTDFYPNYIKTYVERDVREETGVQNIEKFTKFMRLCAASVGSPVNLSSIGNAIGTDSRTISSWLNILEESYIAFRLKAYTKKPALRFSKVPKLYFYDTGLLCSLLGIKATDALNLYDKRGQIFENAVITEYYKTAYNRGWFPSDNTYFWRDSSKREKEVDFIIENGDRLDLYEIKSSQTIKERSADNLRLFEKNSGLADCIKTVIHDGPHNMIINGTAFVNRRGIWDDYC
ncbi:MAG: ATP-binding protein [Clostridiales bacterium]|nr:ATP-binding protein [Clostridiales bacterium]